MICITPRARRCPPPRSRPPPDDLEHVVAERAHLLRPDASELSERRKRLGLRHRDLRARLVVKDVAQRRVAELLASRSRHARSREWKRGR